MQLPMGYTAIELATYELSTNNNIERCQFLYNGHIPERRSGKERRIGHDRRINPRTLK
jgi:hypothetical protein